jgi:hypothetical protein
LKIIENVIEFYFPLQVLTKRNDYKKALRKSKLLHLIFISQQGVTI